MPGEQPLMRSLLLNGSCTRCLYRKVLVGKVLRPFSSSTIRRATEQTERHPAANIAAPEINFDKLPPVSTKNARIIPASPSYFTTKPSFTDDLVELQSILRRSETLPTVEPVKAPRITWKTLPQYRMQVGELVSASRYQKIIQVLQRLNRIHPGLVPTEVKNAIQIHRRAIDPHAQPRKPAELDEFGRSYAAGRRKSSRAQAWLVEGEGEVLINGKNLAEAFGRIHDRESAVWALKSTSRLDKYNVWVTVSGGGTTGQAEAITLAVGKALMVHEPALKPALRRGKEYFLVAVESILIIS